MHSRDTEFERLNGLIRQLAQEVDNGPRGPVKPAGPPAPRQEPHRAAAAPLPRTTTAQWPSTSVADAIAGERIMVYLDPIQGLSDRKPRHFEVSVRLQTADGAELVAEQFMDEARRDGLLGRLDAIKLPRVARVARRIQERGRAAAVLSTFSGDALVDEAFRETAAETMSGTASERLVLAFAQSDVRAFGPVHWQALDMLSECGLRFACEAVTDLDMDFEFLRARGFDFVKLDAAVFLEGMPSPGGMVPSSDLCRHLSEVGLTLIVGRIDDERALTHILGFGVLFGQGALFGGAKPVRADVLGSGQRAA